jgi:hypothetical protein
MNGHPFLVKFPVPQTNNSLKIILRTHRKPNLPEISPGKDVKERKYKKGQTINLYGGWD